MPISQRQLILLVQPVKSKNPDDLLFPIQGKSLFVKVFAHPNWPGFAIDFQIIGALTHQMATQIGPINVQFLQTSSDRKSTRLNSSHSQISYAVFCLKKKKK